MDLDISINIYVKSVDMDIYMHGIFHIHDKADNKKDWVTSLFDLDFR